MKRFFINIGNFFKEYALLLHNVPPLLLSFFLISLVGMNLLANKSIDLGVDWIALDCGIVFSWISFFTMDVLTKRYGPKATIMVTMFGLAANLLISCIFIGASYIPGFWGESFVEGSENTINTALNGTIRGTWYVILGSSVAFIISALANVFMNWGIGKLFKKKPDSFGAFVTRAYVSTFIGQFIDNLTFALIVSQFFFGWNLTQCFMCALTGAVLELVFEAIFSPLGYKIARKLDNMNYGQAYFDYVAERKANA